MSRNTITILLIQVRTDDMKKHEYECFLRYSGLAREQLIAKSAFDDDLSEYPVERFDAVIIGGSGQFSALDPALKETNDRLCALVRRCHEADIPFLGACYGAQIAAIALGGAVETREDMREIGTFEIYETEEGRADPLFSALPSTFPVQLGHKDSVTRLPAGASVLASSKKCPIQVFRFPGKRFYGVQFHPELDKEDLLTRVRYYTDYVEDPTELVRLAENAHDTPAAATIPALFIDTIVLGAPSTVLSRR